MLKADAATSVADKTISVDEFQKVLVYDKQGKVVLNKKGKPSERLAPIRQQVNANCLIQFISELLPVIIHHRNMQKRYRSLIKPFLAMIDTVNMDIDFSENLTLGMKFEPSSMHWVKQQISVHSGILKLDEVKEYHPYISDSRTHDQAFVKVAVDEMFNSSTSNIPEDKNNFSIESDNCTGQYKSSHHFGDMQSLANKHLRMVIRIFSIANHGKDEDDHLGGLAKVAVRQEIARRQIFTTATDVNYFLQDKFAEKTSPVYHCRELSEERLEEGRKLNAMKIFKTVDGSASFHVLVFQPGASKFKAVPRICVMSVLSRSHRFVKYHRHSYSQP